MPPLDRVIAPASAATFLGLGALARRGAVPAGEAWAFRRINDLPGWLGPVLWPVMQAGNLAAVFVVAGTLRRRGRRRAAAVALGTGVGVWAFAKAVKPAFGRARPERHLPGTRIRGRPQSGLGYPSGHAAVSAALAMIVADAVPAWRVPAVAVAVVVAVARVHAGAHLPLDVAGGTALGVAAGLTARRAADLR